MKTCPIPPAFFAVIVSGFVPPAPSRGWLSGRWSNSLDSIPETVSDLKYSRGELLHSIAGLSRRELTEIPIYPGWTIKDVLAHVIGWDQRVLKTLPLMLQNRASEVASVEVDDFNRESVNAWRDK